VLSAENTRCGGLAELGGSISVWYLSEGWMFGRRGSPLGELAKPAQLYNSGDHLVFF
jgi:hypothetical protein